MSDIKNKLIHGFFEVTVLCKGISGILEITSSLLLVLFKPETISRAIISFTHQRIIRHSGAFATDFATNQANHFSSATQRFVAFYLLFYGVINIFLVISLLRGKLWAYPTAVICFSLFTVYMFVRFLFNHSVILSFFVVFDIFLIGLTWLEYQRIKLTAHKI
jgi:uncharacterized membrane protein